MEHDKEIVARPRDDEGAVALAEAVGRVAVATIPVIGGALAQAHSELVLRAQQQRWKAFYLDLAERIPEAQLEALSRDERFVSAVARASMAAARMHAIETRMALLNAVENTASSSLDDDVLHMFISLVETLTPSHVRLLRFLAGRNGVYEKRSELLADVDKEFPDLSAKGIRDRVLLDLHASGLSTADAQPVLSSSAVTWDGDSILDRQLSTRLGDEFLAFIAEPNRTTRD